MFFLALHRGIVVGKSREATVSYNLVKGCFCGLSVRIASTLTVDTRGVFNGLTKGNFGLTEEFILTLLDIDGNRNDITLCMVGDKACAMSDLCGCRVNTRVSVTLREDSNSLATFNGIYCSFDSTNVGTTAV